MAGRKKMSLRCAEIFIEMQFSHRETTNALVNRGTDNWGMCSQPASQARDSGFCPAGNSSVTSPFMAGNAFEVDAIR